MFLLALDIGTKKTGVAFGDTKSGVVMALDTIRHASTEELVKKVKELVVTRNISSLVIGLPLLPSGEEGTQAIHVRDVAKRLEEELKIPLKFADERYTSLGSKTLKNDDAKAACEILFTVLGSQEVDH